VQREKRWINKGLRFGKPHLIDIEKGLRPLIGVHIGTSTEGDVLHKRKNIQGEKLQRRRQGIILFFIVLWNLWNGIARNRPNIAALGNPNQVHTSLLHSHTSIVQCCLQREINSLFGH
jgi:hypothetical protein